MASRDETEPDAQKRRAASELWQMFVALTKEGFSERQALVVIGQILAGAMKEKN
jgi:hypothetical protein